MRELLRTLEEKGSDPAARKQRALRGQERPETLELFTETVHDSAVLGLARSLEQFSHRGKK
jgi:hypothetical protein